MDIPKPRALQSAEDYWMNEIQVAAERYVAISATRKALEIISDVQNEDVQNEAGQYAYTQVLKNENAALAEYRRVLRIFSEVTFNGKLPSEHAK
jgi:hypothetical protein